MNVNNEIKEKFKNYMDINKKEHTKNQNLWDTAKAVSSGDVEENREP